MISICTCDVPLFRLWYVSLCMCRKSREESERAAGRHVWSTGERSLACELLGNLSTQELEISVGGPCPTAGAVSEAELRCAWTRFSLVRREQVYKHAGQHDSTRL